MLELKQIQELHDKAYEYGSDVRDRASDDLVFYWVTQWDDGLLGDSTLKYRGQFDMLRKAGRDILSQLRSNEIQVDFEPEGEMDEDLSELLDGHYRAIDSKNFSQEAYQNAKMETVVCGVGAWKIYTEYESDVLGDERQVIKRKPIHEANNKVFWDPNAKAMDKSDAKFCSVLHQLSEDAFTALCEEHGEDPDLDSFGTPNQSYAFPWMITNEGYYITEFYELEEVIEKNINLRDPLGMEIWMRDFEMEKIEDELLDSGYEIIGEKKVKRNRCTMYLCSGSKIIHSQRIAGENIPIVPEYGERCFVEGVESYEGITRLAKDPQRLRNFQLSYLADIVSKSPRKKPVYLAEQIAGLEEFYEENGSDNDYPYLLQNKKGLDGEDLPLGRVDETSDPTVPPALIAMTDLSRQAIEDVANPALPQDIADTDTSGVAVQRMQQLVDRQAHTYQEHYKFAKRRDGEIFASMAGEIYDTPRKLEIVKKDGTREKVEIMQYVINEDMEQIAVNDLTGQRFNVYADIGIAYDNQREQTIEQLGQMAMEVRDSDPALHKALMLKRLQLMPGVDTDDIKDYANKQLVMMGFKEAETEEEMLMVQQAQNQPDPQAAMMQAESEARLMEGHAAMQNEQNDANKNAIDMFKAESDRMKVQIQAEQAGVSIQDQLVSTNGKQLDNAKKIQELKAIRQQQIAAENTPNVKFQNIRARLN